MLRKPIQMSDRERIDSSVGLGGVAGEHTIEPAVANGALPPVPRVVLRRSVNFRGFGRKRPGSVTNRVRSENADRENVGIGRKLRNQLCCGCRSARRPRRVRMKAMPFVEENTLRAL